MDKLLNVKEAAALLNVSQMTIRRWTNAGLLRCFRIGKKLERRFSPQDLQTFIKGEPDSRDTGLSRLVPGTANSVDLGFGNITVPDGMHFTHFYFDLQEVLEFQALFLQQGLKNGETVLLVSPDDRRDKLLQTLDDTGLAVMDLMNQERLHHSSGKDDPSEMSVYIAQVASSARGRFRLVGDMSWTIAKQWPKEQIRTLEETTNTRMKPGYLFMCQYSLTEFSGRETMMALETHNLAVYKGKLGKSPLF